MEGGLITIVGSGVVDPKQTIKIFIYTQS